jgi:hypothetical protein
VRARARAPRRYPTGSGSRNPPSLIGHVARKNHVPVIILRAVTDVLDSEHPSATTGDIAAWQRQTEIVMQALVELAADALPDLTSVHASD